MPKSTSTRTKSFFFSDTALTSKKGRVILGNTAASKTLFDAIRESEDGNGTVKFEQSFHKKLISI